MTGFTVTDEAVEAVAREHWEYGQGGMWDRPEGYAGMTACASDMDKATYRAYARRLLEAAARTAHPEPEIEGVGVDYLAAALGHAPMTSEILIWEYSKRFKRSVSRSKAEVILREFADAVLALGVTSEAAPADAQVPQPAPRDFVLMDNEKVYASGYPNTYRVLSDDGTRWEARDKVWVDLGPTKKQQLTATREKLTEALARAICKNDNTGKSWDMLEPIEIVAYRDEAGLYVEWLFDDGVVQEASPPVVDEARLFEVFEQAAIDRPETAHPATWFIQAARAAGVFQTEAEVQAEALSGAADGFGVNVESVDGEWWKGYRQAQREIIQTLTTTAAAIRAGGQ